MRLCIVSKFPPIQGQVSTVNYWLARGLAAAHSVLVVTDGSHAEATSRVMMEEPQPPLDETITPPTVWMTGGDGAPALSWANPSVTPLAGLAMRAVEEGQADLIFSQYLEPYAVAGHLAASLTGVPHVITHAGSDIGRLCHQADLRRVYHALAQRSARFVAKNQTAAAFAGVPLQGVERPLPFMPPPEFFNPARPPLDVNACLERYADVIRGELAWRTDRFSDEEPVIGVYGKLLDTKGIFDLTAALGEAAAAGARFSFLIMSRWRKGEPRLREAIHGAGIAERTWWLPLLPNWTVPAFIRRCDIVAFLERGWPHPPHTSLIPKEVLACGTCLLISDEARRHPWFRDRLADGVNCLVVPEPRRTSDLARRLTRILGDVSELPAIAKNGAAAAASFPSHAAFLRSWEAIFESCLAGVRR
jgi:glycosyltransferase involved in cell wall biosynthesis